MSEIIQLTEKDFESIEEILEAFDFEKVHKVMKFLNWGWYVPNEEFKEEEANNLLIEYGLYRTRVPSISELRQTARKLLKDAAKGAYQSGTYYTATGGFWVDGFYEEGDKVPFMCLKFVVTEWSN